MRAFFADFMKIGPRPERGLTGDSLVLGTESSNPELKMLQRDDDVIATDESELWAQGKAVPVDHDGERWWYVHRIERVYDILKTPLPAGTTGVTAGVA